MRRYSFRDGKKFKNYSLYHLYFTQIVEIIFHIMKKNIRFSKIDKNICDKYNCTFYNLESSIKDDYGEQQVPTY